jgi:hypothetical protein
LAEALTGDHRRDFHADRLLRACQIRDVTEPCAREAARLRTATGHAAAISAANADERRPEAADDRACSGGMMMHGCT